VVGVDAARESRAAVDWAAREAASRHLPLRIVHSRTLPALTPWASRVDDDLSASIHAYYRLLLQRYATQAAKVPGVSVSTYQLDRAADRVLGECASHAVLLVVGSHHSRALTRAISSSTGTASSAGAAVSAGAACPVAVVPPRQDREPPGLPVVVALTPYSDVDARLVDFGLDYARRHRSPIRFVTCWHPPLGNHTLPPPHELHVWISELVSGCRDRYPEVDRVQLVVRRARPRATLLAEADHATLLVLGRRHEHTHLGSLMGSTAREAVNNAACPVVIVPPAWSGE
jgi:nucleotide-binding universal stress UspA family protein